jgi:hypothetical protein
MLQLNHREYELNSNGFNPFGPFDPFDFDTHNQTYGESDQIKIPRTRAPTFQVPTFQVPTFQVPMLHAPMLHVPTFPQGPFSHKIPHKSNKYNRKNKNKNKITEIEVSPEKTIITKQSCLDEKLQTIKFLNTNGNDFPSKFLEGDPGEILCGVELPMSFKMKNYHKAKFSETGGMSNHGIVDGPKSFKPTGKVCAILIDKTCCEFGKEIEPHYNNSRDSRGVKEFGSRSTKFTEIIVSGGESFWLIVLHLPVGNTKLDIKRRTSYRILKSIIGQAHHIEKTTKKHVCIVGDFNLTRKEIMIFKKNEEGLVNDYQKIPIPLPSTLSSSLSSSLSKSNSNHNFLRTPTSSMNLSARNHIGTFKTAIDLLDLSSDLSSDLEKDSNNDYMDQDLDLEYVTSINQEDGKTWDIDYIFVSEQSKISFYEIDRSIIGKKGNNGNSFDHAILFMQFSH